MNKYINQGRFKNIILLCFALVYILLLAHNIRFNILHGLYDWVFSDWLINYSSGFVRRGLAGTILLFLAENIARFNVQIALMLFVYAIYLLISIIYLFKIRENQEKLSSIDLFTFLFLPSLLFFPLIDNGALGRKESLFLILLILNIKIVGLTIRQIKTHDFDKNSFFISQGLDDSIKYYCSRIFIWLNIFAIPFALTHESMLFLSLPINFLITITIISLAFPARKALVYSCLIYIPTFLAALTAFIWKGDIAAATNICESWQVLEAIDCSNGPPAALAGISWTLKNGLSHSWRIVKENNGLTLLKWLVIFALNLIFVTVSSSRLIANRLKNLKIAENEKIRFIKTRKMYAKFSLNYCIIPLIFSMPLYILGWDWGRWFFITLIGYTFCILSPDLTYLEFLKQNKNIQRDSTVSRILDQSFILYSKMMSRFLNTVNKYYLLYVALLCYTIFFLKVPNCCLVDAAFYTGLKVHFERLFRIFILS